jgi:hypothetical protein
LEAVNAIAQLIAAIGVIVSLFYLAAQIRQNTRSMRAVVVDSLAHSLVDLLGPKAYDPKSMRAFSLVVENWHGASEEDRIQRCLYPCHVQAFRKCMVPATPEHSRFAAMGRLGCLHSHVLSPPRRKDVVADAARGFHTGFLQLH